MGALVIVHEPPAPQGLKGLLNPMILLAVHAPEEMRAPPATTLIAAHGLNLIPKQGYLHVGDKG